MRRTARKQQKQHIISRKSRRHTHIIIRIVRIKNNHTKQTKHTHNQTNTDTTTKNMHKNNQKNNNTHAEQILLNIRNKQLSYTQEHKQ